MIAGVAHAVARLPTLDVPAHGDHRAGRAVAGAEGELPVGQVRILEPLVRPGVDGQFGAGAHGADRGFHEDLIGGRGEKIDFANSHLERLLNDGLACAHDWLHGAGVVGLLY